MKLTIALSGCTTEIKRAPGHEKFIPGLQYRHIKETGSNYIVRTCAGMSTDGRAILESKGGYLTVSDPDMWEEDVDKGEDS